MYPFTPDYSQQMTAYLHAWRQFLEQWAVMLPPVPSTWPMAPYLPFMLPMPPVMPPPPGAASPPGQPASADYAEQLFGCLQAWRQRLEQMLGAAPGPKSQQPPTSNRPARDTGGKGSKAPCPPQQLDRQPQSHGGSQDIRGGLGQTSDLEDIQPASEYRSEFKLSRPNPLRPGVDAAQLLNPPDYAYGYLDRPGAVTSPAGAAVYTAQPDSSFQRSEAAPQLPMASPFSAPQERVEPTVSPPPAAKSLFSTAGAEVAAPAKIAETGQKPSS